MKKIILASASPRRRELLAQLGIVPIVYASSVTERILPGEIPEVAAMSLAFQKAVDAEGRYKEGLIIAADTIVVLKGRIMGKPSNRAEAFDMLKNLSGKTHEVITGFAIIDPESGTKVVDYEKTLVRFRVLDEDRINAYIESGECEDKAGSYGIQGKGALLVDKIEGCYFNIVGLPLSKVGSYFDSIFGINLL